MADKSACAPRPLSAEQSRSRSAIVSTRRVSTPGCRSMSSGYRGAARRFSQFKGGQSNPTYRLDTPGHSYVLRRKPLGKLLPSAHAVDREFRVISALHPIGFPVAKPSGSVHGRRRDRLGLLHHGRCRGAHFLGRRRCPSFDAPPSAARSTKPKSRRSPVCTVRSRGDRARRLRQAGQLFRPSDRPLDEAVPRLGDQDASTRWSG